MRLDKFLKTAQLIKRRTVANEAADEGFIKVNGRDSKPALQLKAGDIIEIDMWNYYKKIEVIIVPEKNTIPKKDIDKYIKLLEYKAKEIEFWELLYFEDFRYWTYSKKLNKSVKSISV